MNREFSRQLIHISMAGFALTFPLLTAPWAFLLAAGAFLHNIFLLPQYAPQLFREREKLSQGIALYPVMVGVLILLFPTRLYLAAGAWGILAFGDGFSTLVGRRWPLSPLPWNPRKSLGGLLSFMAAGSAAAWLMMAWNAPDAAWRHLAMTAAGAAGVAAIYESLPLPWDDNLVVALIAALFLCLFWDLDWSRDTASITGFQWGVALVVNVLAASLAWWLGFVSSSGAGGGLFLGTIILAMGNWEMYALLLFFFVLASIATRIGYHEKMIIGGAQEKGGRRGAKHALANCLLPAAAVIALGSSNGADLLLALFFCGALATALGDTISSELGQVYGRNPFLPTTFRRVAAGTVGAVSVEGLLFGMGAGGLMAGIAAGLGVITWALIPAVTIGSWLGFYAESYIGGYWTEEGYEVNNEWMNLLNTFIGGTMALAVGLLTHGW
ncbi:MAG: DUF92 domain-containing protein [bacterium]